MNILNACSFNLLLPLIQDNLYALALVKRSVRSHQGSRFREKFKVLHDFFILGAFSRRFSGAKTALSASIASADALA
jgi:hypothetical protein